MTLPPLPPMWKHQAHELEVNAHKPRLMLHWSPRIGKTRTAAEFMTRKPEVRRLVVTAPLAVCPDWVDMLVALGWTVIPAFTTPVAKLTMLRQFRDTGTRFAVVINDDKISRGEDELLRWQPQGAIIDESHRCKKPTGKRSKSMRRIAFTAQYLRLLTGTPGPNHYGDLWAQMNAIDREAFGYTYASYRDKYLITDPQFPQRIMGHKNTDQLQALLLKYTSIVRREDVFGPDDWQYVARNVELPARARKLYDTFAKEWMIEGPNISADNVLERILRLRQIAAGFVSDKQSGVVEVLHNVLGDRLHADLDEVVESGEKAVVFYQFRWEGAQAAMRARADLGVPVYEVHGGVEGNERQRITQEFNTTPGSRIAFVQLQAGGTGISFADAAHLMFLSSTFSFSDMEQARDRVYAPDPALGKGKRRVVTSYRASDTIHAFIGQVLDRKGNIHEALRNSDREAIAYGRFKRSKI